MSGVRSRILATLLLASVFAGSPPAARAAGRFQFTDIAAESGLLLPTWCGGLEKPHLLESGGTGLALFDYDLDGDLDLYLVNGWRLDGSEVVERGRNLLYRNLGDGRFENVTERAGVGDDQWGTGIGVGDYDGNGYPDLMLTNFGRDILYRNRGDGTFEEVADGPGIDNWSTSAVFFDAEWDGDLDLFIAGYVDATMEEVLFAKPDLLWEGINVMVGPFGLDGLGNRFYRNVGNGRFVDETEEAGLEDVGLYYTFAVAVLDLDGDRDLDIYAANDSNPNYLYSNDGTGRFEEVGLWSGAALDQGGMGQAGMGLAAADFDNDGLPDLLVTNFSQDTTTLYRNLGNMMFSDITRTVGLYEPTFRSLSWGPVLADFEHDGDLDLFIANGHIYPQADQRKEKVIGFRQPNLLFENRDGQLVEVSSQSGPGLAVRESSRGVSAGDVDGDGDLDLMVSNVDAPPTLLRNESEARGRWLIADAPGAIIATLESSHRKWTRHRVYGASYVSESDSRFHFGLGESGEAPRLTLEYPKGHRLVVTGLPTDRSVRFAAR